MINLLGPALSNNKGFTTPPTPPYTRLGADTAHSQLWRKLQLKASPSTLQAALFLRRPVLCGRISMQGCPRPIPRRCLCETPWREVGRAEGCGGGLGGGDLNIPFSALGCRDSAVHSFPVLLFPLLPSFDQGSLGLMSRCCGSIFGIFALVYILNI